MGTREAAVSFRPTRPMAEVVAKQPERQPEPDTLAAPPFDLGPPRLVTRPADTRPVNAAITARLLDPGVMQATIARDGIAGLIADFHRFGTSASHNRVARELRQSAAILKRDLGQLANQLLGRLLPSDGQDIATMLTGLQGETGQAAVRPLTASLRADAAEIDRLQTFGAPPLMLVATALCVLSDGRLAVAGANHIALWDIDAHVETARIEAIGHLERTQRFVRSPDGREFPPRAAARQRAGAARDRSDPNEKWGCSATTWTDSWGPRRFGADFRGFP